jgi:hypothetical protein
MTDIVAIILAVALVAGAFLGWQGRKLFDRIEGLEKKIEELSAIAGRRKLPYPAQAGLEDAIAIAIELLDQHQAQRAYDETRIGQLAERLRQVRSDPQHYDANQPDRATRRRRHED